jgi:hypothetical protein
MKITVSPSNWIEFLEIVNLGDMIAPVEVFYNKDEELSVRASDKTKSVQYVIPAWTLFGSTIEGASEGDSFIVDPVEILGDMMKFKKSREIIIDITDAGIEISDDHGNEISYPAKSKSTAVTIPADKTPKFDEHGKVLFKKKVIDDKGNASVVSSPATSTVLIDSTQIQLAVNDMTKHAKTEYIEFTFGAEGSFSQTGHMGTKTKMSKSALLATVYGADVSFILPKTFASLVSPFEGELEIQGSEDTLGVLVKYEKVGKGDVLVVIMRQKVAKSP